MKRCVRCTLPEVFLNIEYNSDGVCSICYEWDQKWGKAKNDNKKESEEKIIQLAEKLKKKKSKYDCVVGFSGGKDSVFTLYLLKKKYDLNPLAVNLSNGYQDEEIKTWIPAITKKLEVDLIIHKLDYNYFYGLMKKAFLRTSYLCLWCNLAVFSACQRIAKENNISFIFLGGGSRLEINTISDHHELDYYNYARSVFKDDSSIDWSDYYIDKKLCNEIQMIWMGDYITWKHKDFIKTIEDEFDIKYPKKGLDYIHTDCIVPPVQSYVHFKRNKFTRSEYSISNLIRDGQLTRKEGLKLIEDEIKMFEKWPKATEELLKRINIEKSEFEEILNKSLPQAYRPPWYHGENK